MKEIWKTPRVEVQVFKADSYCGSCTANHYLVMKADIMSIEGGNIYFESNGIAGFQWDQYYPERVVGDQQVNGAQDQTNIPDRYTSGGYLVVKDAGQPGYYWNGSSDPTNMIVREGTVVYALQYYNNNTDELWHADTNSWYLVKPGGTIIADVTNAS